MSRPPPPHRQSYPFYVDLPTRWMDNDLYGHINNVVYYSYFDTAIAHYLMREGGLDPRTAPVIGIAVETGCRFHQSLSFPDVISAGVRVARLGTSSVRYEIGLFRGPAERAAADGHFVHVFVDRATQRPTPMPERIREALEHLRT